VSGLFFAVGAYRRLRDPTQRAVTFGAVAAIVIFINQCYGDMAFWTDIGQLLVGMALAVAGKAAGAVGGWPAAPQAGAPMRGGSGTGNIVGLGPALKR